MWVVVPVKQFHLAKQRLSTILSDDERVYLAKMMLHDVLQSITNSSEVSHTILISSDPAVAEVAHAFGSTYLEETDAELSLAVAQGGAYAQKRGARAFAMIPGDVPLVTASDISNLLKAVPEQAGMAIVADRHGNGTNGLVVKPVDLMPFQFGVNSFHLHTEAAQQLGVKVNQVSAPSLSLDIDTAGDLLRLLDNEAETASGGYLKSIEVWNRLNETAVDRIQTAEAG